MEHSQQDGSADHSYQYTVEVESSDTFHPEGGEERTPYDCADDAENDVQYDTSACPIDDLAGDKSGDESEKDPCKYRHDCLLAMR
jgi:hypothetical protein